MTLRRFISLSMPVVVSVFGLMSCSRDEKPDSWTLSEPAIEEPGSGKRPFSISSLQKLHGESELVFRESETLGGVLSVHGVCQSEIGVTETKASISSPARVPLLSLWPKDLLLKLNNESLKKSSCSFEFEMKSSKASTHRFQLSSVQLQNFTSPQTANFPEQVSQETISDFAKASASLGLRNSQKSETHLVCENFSTLAAQFKFQSQSEDLLQKLFFGPLQDASMTTKSEADPRNEKTKQMCHLVFIQEFGSGSKTLISKEFEVLFPPPRLEIKVQWLTRHVTYKYGNNVPLFAVSVRNTSSIKTALKISEQIGRARVQMLMNSYLLQVGSPTENIQENFALSAKVALPQVKLETTGGRKFWHHQGYLIAEMEPKESITFQVVMKTSCFSTILYDSTSSKPESDPILNAERGFYFDLEKPFVIEQYRQWGQEPSLQSETINVSPLQLKARTEMSPRNFVALESYYRALGEEASEPIGYIPMIKSDNQAWQFTGCQAKRMN